MQVESELQQLTRFIPIESLMAKVSLPLRYLPEPVTGLLPSIVLSGDGLSLVRVLLATEHYLCDVRLASPEEVSEFDFVAKHTVKNYRFRVWTHVIKDGESIKASYDIAQIHLLHELAGQFATQLDYAGDNRAGWLARVIDVFPIRLVLGPSVSVKG